MTDKTHLDMSGRTGPKGVAEGASDHTSESSEIVVFWIRRDSTCAECGEELGRGRFLRVEGERPLCLKCADLAHLTFLPRGDAALTRRANRYSRLRAVVVRFSITRKRYERQGTLVEEEALARAEGECLADAEARQRARERAAERRADLDAVYGAAFAQRVGELFPGCPESERQAISEHACLKHSGRVGRSAAAKELQEEAIELAVRAHVRHHHTVYDGLLGRGMLREEARQRVAAETDRKMREWQRPRA